MAKKKPSIGRQKIAIKKIPKKNHLQVTFSKRRAGLFKKASELCTLCGVEIAIIVFSPASKAFSFGHPEVDSIVERFLTRNSPPSSSAHNQLIEAHRNANVRELNMQLSHILNQLEAEKKQAEALEEMRKTSEGQRCWWEGPISELDLCKLQQLKDAMEELKQNVAYQANKMLVESTTNFSPFVAANNGVGHQDFDLKPNVISSASTVGYHHVNNFGHGHGIF